MVMAELYGRATGCCGGRGGSMHLFDPEVGLFGTNGFVGGGIPAAVGAAISAKVRGTDSIAVAFFGDGAVNHGAFHERLNFATIQQAPVIFVCENNLYATATPFTVATKNTSVASRATGYGLPGVEVDGNDVLAVWEAMREATERARSGKGPTLIECKTYRTVGHHEGDPLVGTYRNQEELDAWKGDAQFRSFASVCSQRSWLKNPSWRKLMLANDREIEEAVAFAESSPMPERQPQTSTCLQTQSILKWRSTQIPLLMAGTLKLTFWMRFGTGSRRKCAVTLTSYILAKVLVSAEGVLLIPRDFGKSSLACE